MPGAVARTSTFAFSSATEAGDDCREIAEDHLIARRNVGLREAANAVHSVRHEHAVPVDGGVLGQLVGDENADLVALDCLECNIRSGKS